MAKISLKQKRIKKFKALEKKYKNTEAWARQQALGNVLEKVTKSEKAYKGFLASFRASKSIVKTNKLKAERKRKEKKERNRKIKEKGLTDLTDETLKAKEFMTDMISNRMDGVSDELIDRAKEAIYNATDEELDDLADMFGNGWNGWKEFYEHNHEYQAGANTVAEKEGRILEILEYLE